MDIAEQKFQCHSCELCSQIILPSDLFKFPQRRTEQAEWQVELYDTDKPDSHFGQTSQHNAILKIKRNNSKSPPFSSCLLLEAVLHLNPEAEGNHQSSNLLSRIWKNRAVDRVASKFRIEPSACVNLKIRRSWTDDDAFSRSLETYVIDMGDSRWSTFALSGIIMLFAFCSRIH